MPLASAFSCLLSSSDGFSENWASSSWGEAVASRFCSTSRNVPAALGTRAKASSSPCWLLSGSACVQLRVPSLPHEPKLATTWELAPLPIR